MTRTGERTSDLRLMLIERRLELQSEAHGIRHGIQEDIEPSLLPMQADTVTRIDAALARLEAGKYGSCIDCERDIAEGRLRALPFVARCQACEEQRENAQGRERRRAAQTGSSGHFPLFPELAGG